MVEKVEFSELDPLRLLTHKNLFQDKEGGEEEEKQEQEEDQKILEIWKSLHKNEGKEITPSFLSKFITRPALRELARALNSNEIQESLKTRFLMRGSREDPFSSDLETIKQNLHRLNIKIEAANKRGWFRRFPIMWRLFPIIEKIRIPHP